MRAEPVSTDDEKWEQRIRSTTALVREDSHALYAAIRRSLTERGIDVAQSLFADVAEEDVDTEGGLIVTPDKKWTYITVACDLKIGRTATANPMRVGRFPLRSG
jgi:hypothetical protein